MAKEPVQSTTGLALARLWSEAPALLPHAAGCACAGHVAMHLDPTAVEADVLDYLAARYEAEGNTGPARLIAERRAARGIGFASWLIGLDVAPMPEAARARLLADLETVISSLAAAAGGHR